MTETSKQRLRITFTRDATLKYIGHLDMARTWQRILRRADLPLGYSEGFNPQPKITFAAALPLGCTSEHEVMDIVLSQPCDVADVTERLKRALPPGMVVTSIEVVATNAPALQTQLVASEYMALVENRESVDRLSDKVQALLDAAEVRRERRGKVYDLRPLVQALTVQHIDPGRALIRMRLQSTDAGTGRPDEVVDALGLKPAEIKIQRTRLIFLDKTD